MTWPTGFLRTLGIEIVFGREGRLGTRTIRITAVGENRLHDTVSIASRVSDHGAGLKPLSARGTGAFIAQTLLTVLTQNNSPSSGKDIAAARSKLVITSSMTILAAARGRKVYSLHAPEVECIGKGKTHRPPGQGERRHHDETFRRRVIFTHAAAGARQSL